MCRHREGNGHSGSAFHSVKDLDYEEKVRTIREHSPAGVYRRLHTQPNEFKKIPGYPFVYWISDRIRELVQEVQAAGEVR